MRFGIASGSAALAKLTRRARASAVASAVCEPRSRTRPAHVHTYMDRHRHAPRSKVIGRPRSTHASGRGIIPMARILECILEYSSQPIGRFRTQPDVPQCVRVPSCARVCERACACTCPRVGACVWVCVRTCCCLSNGLPTIASGPQCWKAIESSVPAADAL
jgi:hypothetical protein